MRTKAQATKPVDRDEWRHTQWTLCRLSRRPLAAPVMVDRLGQLYTKEAVIEYLLRRSTKTTTGADDEVASHIRSLKVRCAPWLTPHQDVRVAHLHPNPTPEAKLGETQYFPHACPLTQRVMNGQHRFVCLWPCGCVMSEAGLRETCAATKKSASAACPVCATPFDASALWRDTPDVRADVVALYPDAATREQLRAQCQTKKRKKAPDADTAKRARAALEGERLPEFNSAAPGAYAMAQVKLAQASAQKRTNV